MQLSLLDIFDLIGTIAFAISGAFVGIHKKMDIFGVNVLAITTACGGGLMRDIIIGHVPPRMFENPVYVLVAAIVANIVFICMYRHDHMPSNLAVVYEKMLFWFDTLGLAAFTVDGVTVGVDAGFYENPFLLCFLGFMTGVGGGALRDVLANQTPDIFRKHIYALAAIAGGICMVLLFSLTESQKAAMIGGFLLVLVLRVLAAHYRWNLPTVK